MQPMRTIIKNAKKYVVFRVLPFILACFMLFTSAPLAVFSVSVPECDCTNTSTDLSAHTDSCAKKSYIRNTYIKENTAEQIYAEWSSLDTDIQTAVLTFLSWDDYTKYTALTALINSGDTSDGYPTTGSDKIAVDMDIPEGAFPEGTQASIQPIDAKDYCTYIETAISDIDDSSEVLALYAFDISFLNNGEELQPSQSIGITFTVPASLVPSDARTAMIFHIVDYGVEDSPNYFSISDSGDQSFTISADSFSSYVIAMTGQYHKATLLRDALTNPNYSIVTLPVNMFKYDTDVFNNACEQEAGNENYLKFVNENNASTFAPNIGGNMATQGILKNTLDANGYPVMAYGYNNGKAVFGTSAFTGKTIYENVQFEFVYDKSTGYYQYNSAINHAELNNGKVELYTDTMGPYNYRVSIAQDTARNGTTKHLTFDTTNTDTVKFVTTGNDPYIILNHTDRALANYNYLYFRIYSSASETVGTDKDGLMLSFDFTSDGSGSDFGDGTVALNLKQGWNEYYFDVSKYSAETLARTSVNFGSKSGVTFEIAEMGFVKTANFYTAMTNAGFYPFADISKSYLNGDYTTFDENAWETALNSAATQERATRSFLNKEYSSPAPTDNFHFGLSLELDFYLPADKMTNDGDDIIFEFSGDDDLWVFVDDKLVLDVGGLHTRVDGKIDFTNGKTWVSSSRVITNSTTTGDKISDKTADFSISSGYHSIKIFYLERASTASNCRFYFNLPTIPTGAVEVTKKVVDESGLADVKNIDFDFNIKVDNAPYANREFSVVTYNDSGKPVSVEARKTDGNGGFKLRHNQTASFADIDENKRVLVTETPDTRFTANASQLEKITVKDKTITFSFVNTVILTELVIDKTVSAVTKDENDFENPSFLFRVKGTGFTGNVDIIVSINITANDTTNNVGNDSVRITNIPIGFYTVTELTDWSWEYAAINAATAENVIKSSGATASEITVEIGKVNDNRNPTVFFTNTDTDPNWLNGEGHNENQFDIND